MSWIIMLLGANNNFYTEVEKVSMSYLGRNSETIDRLGGRVTAPIKRTTFGWRNLRIIRT